MAWTRHKLRGLIEIYHSYICLLPFCIIIFYFSSTINLHSQSFITWHVKRLTFRRREAWPASCACGRHPETSRTARPYVVLPGVWRFGEIEILFWVLGRRQFLGHYEWNFQKISEVEISHIFLKFHKNSQVHVKDWECFLFGSFGVAMGRFICVTCCEGSPHWQRGVAAAEMMLYFSRVAAEFFLISFFFEIWLRSFLYFRGMLCILNHLCIIKWIVFIYTANTYSMICRYADMSLFAMRSRLGSLETPNCFGSGETTRNQGVVVGASPVWKLERIFLGELPHGWRCFDGSLFLTKDAMEVGRKNSWKNHTAVTWEICGWTKARGKLTPLFVWLCSWPDRPVRTVTYFAVTKNENQEHVWSVNTCISSNPLETSCATWRFVEGFQKAHCLGMLPLGRFLFLGSGRDWIRFFGVQTLKHFQLPKAREDCLLPVILGSYWMIEGLELKPARVRQTPRKSSAVGVTNGIDFWPLCNSVLC